MYHVQMPLFTGPSYSKIMNVLNKYIRTVTCKTKQTKKTIVEEINDHVCIYLSHFFLPRYNVLVILSVFSVCPHCQKLTILQSFSIKIWIF